MAKIDKETIEQLTTLCRIDCTEEEQLSLLEDLKKILSYIEQLQQIDTEEVPPCNHILETMANVMREDTVGEVMNRDEFLANAPAHVGGMVKVPPVIKQG
jgi:aspartyl-tRNA(Asn)/glutamyl-tRNA(Gln) amidotransferase subunit C